MSWHYLREVAGESLEDICLGGEPLPPLKSKITHAEFYCNGKLTDSYLDSLSGTISAPLTDTHGEAKSMSSAVDSLVRTLVPQEKEMDLTESGQDSGHTWRGWLARFDPFSCSWRTAQCSLLGEEHESLQILPKWGMTRDGLLWELPTLAHLTSETECGSSERLPTPQSTDYRSKPTSASWKAKGGLNFSLANPEIQINWPTPNARDWKDSQTAGNRKSPGLGVVAHLGTSDGGQLNPTWVEWLMGWPVGWTDLKPLAMDKSHCAPQQHGES